MNKKTILASLAVLGIFQVASIGIAGPAQRSDLPADPAWVIHLDADALRPTAVGKFLLEQLAKPPAEEKLAAFQAIFSFDPRAALHGISLYSTGPNAADGVLIMYADFDAGRLETLAKGAEDYKSSKHGSHTIHNWIDNKRKEENGVKPRTFAAIVGKRILFGQKEEAVAKALDVIDGSASSLASGKNFPNVGATGDGNFLEAGGRKLQVPSGNPNAALLKLSDEIRLDLGESNSRIKGTLTIRTANDEVAGHFNSIAQGLLALLKLQKEKPAQVRFADAFELSLRGPEVIGSLSIPSSDAISAIKALERNHAAAKEPAQ